MYVSVHQHWVIRNPQIENETALHDASRSTTTTTLITPSNSLGSKLQTARLKKRMSIPDVAARLKIDAKQVAMYESSADVPNAAMLTSLRELLGDSL